MQHKEFIIKNLKSAVAFFFLFFLNGTSIENGQQGISYNVCIAAAYWPHNLLFNQLIKLNNIKYESNEQNPRTETGRSSEVYA